MRGTRRILVVFYSLTGNTERVANDIAARFGADVERIHERTRRRGPIGLCRAVFDSLRERPATLEGLARKPSDYDLTIVGTPVWAGKVTPAIRTYLRRNRGGVNDVAFFTTSGSTDGTKLVPILEALVDRAAVAAASFDDRSLRDAGTYEQKLDSFAAEIRAELGPVAAPRKMEPA